MNDMDLYQVMDLIASQRDLAVQAWNMFITVHIAIIGGLFFVYRQISKMERIIAYTVYLGFLWVNFRAQIDNYTLLSKLIKKASYLESQIAYNPVQLTGDINVTPPMIAFVPLVYGMAAILTGMTILWINKISVKVSEQ